MAKDLIDELRDERQALLNVARQLRSTTDRDERSALIRRVDADLQAHTRVQQEMVYPLLRKRASSAEVNEHIQSELAAFGEARNLAGKLLDTPPHQDHFRDRAHRLDNLLAAHLDGAGRDLLEDAKTLLDDGERHALGMKAGRRYAELAGHWSGAGRPTRGAM